MTRMRHEKRPPELDQLFALLARHDIRYVLTGSVAALLYGVEVTPGDLDVTPARDRANLERLATLLLEIEATPADAGGRWELQPDGERRWIKEEPTAEALASWRTWQPDSSDIASMDHLFVSRYGNFDVVPDVAGSYEWLMERARPVDAGGASVWVAHIDDLLARLTIPRRQKDVPRVQQLRAIQRERG